MFLCAYHRQRSVENREADYLGFRNVRAVGNAARREEKCPRGVRRAGLLPLAGQHINKLVGLWVNVRWYSDSCVKFAKHRHAAGLLVPVEEH